MEEEELYNLFEETLRDDEEDYLPNEEIPIGDKDNGNS